MIRKAWQGLSPFLEHPVRQFVVLTMVSVFVGFAEASVLVLVVHTALAMAGANGSTVESLPIINTEVSSSSLLWLAAALGLLSILGHFLQARLKARAMSGVSANSRIAAIDAFIGASWDRQAQDREGALQETTSTLVARLTSMAGSLVSGTASIVNLAAFLLIAAVINPVAMGVVLVFGAFLAQLMRPLSRLSQRRSRMYTETNSQFVEEISRTTSLAMEYRAFGVQGAASNELHKLIEQTSRREYTLRFAANFNETLYRDLAALFLVGALAGMYFANGVEVASIGTVVVLIVRGLAYSQTVQIQSQSIRVELPNLEAYQRRVGDLAVDIVEYGHSSIGEITSIEFRNVGYEYLPGVPALAGISLDIRPGEVIGIVGPSGCGKSTFVQVLLRLRLPTQGAVLINGRSYEEYDEAGWAQQMALVPQEPKLMEATIADNISFLRSEISRRQIEEAAQDAHVSADIRKLAGGFDTMLGSRGLGLSGGQKQRVAIARALVGRPNLLVLDEPTSALDMNSERLLQATIGNLKGAVTMVIVAHRLSTLDVCDRLLVLRDGRIEAFGTRAELESQAGFYQSVMADLESTVDESGSDDAVGEGTAS